MENTIYRVHIDNDSDFMDENVYIDITLPDTPKVNDYLRLTFKQIEELEKKVKANFNIGRSYIPYWLHGAVKKASRTGGIYKEECINDIFFNDAQYVKNVMFNADSNIIHIELGDDPDKTVCDLQNKEYDNK